jgi:hypothetical protein
VPQLDPFSGPAHPARPILRRFEVEPQIAPPQSHAAMAAVLERQEQLAAQMRELERARLVQERRAAEIAATKPAAEPLAPIMNRGSLLADLHQKQGLRRAVVLREVLGAPVALR